MASVTTIVRDTSALIRSTVTTLVALAIGLTGLVATLTALNIVPDDQKGALASVAAAAAIVTTAGRSVIAWLDKNNPSFGRVAVEVPELEIPAEATEQDELVIETAKPDEFPEVDQTPDAFPIEESAEGEDQ